MSLDDSEEIRNQDSLNSSIEHYLSLRLDDLLEDGNFRTQFSNKEEELAYDIATLVTSGILVVDDPSEDISDAGNLKDMEMYCFDSRDPQAKLLLKRIENEKHERLTYDIFAFDKLKEKGIVIVPAYSYKQTSRFTRAVNAYLDYLVTAQKRKIPFIDLAYAPLDDSFRPAEGTISVRVSGCRSLTAKFLKHCPISTEHIMVDGCENMNIKDEIMHLTHLVSLVASNTPTAGEVKIPLGTVVVDLSNTHNLDGLVIPSSVEYLVASLWQFTENMRVPLHLQKKIDDYNRSRAILATKESPYEIDAPPNDMYHSKRGKIRLGSTLVVDGTKKRNNYESLEAQIARLFPNARPERVGAVAAKLGVRFNQLERTTDQTCSEAVGHFYVNRKRIEFKISREKAYVAKAAVYHAHAWKHGLLRPITPKLLGFVEVEDGAALLTYHTMNKGIVPTEDAKAYFRLRRTLFAEFSKLQKIKADDPYMIDVFNRALAHTYMRNNVNDPAYTSSMRSVVMPFEQLVERASITTAKDLLAELRGYETVYNEARKRFDDSMYNGILTIVNLDARPENVFDSNLGTRPLGDWDFAQVGLPEDDLAKLEAKNSLYYTAAYAFFRNKLEQERGNDFELTERDINALNARVAPLSFMNAVRTFSWRLGRNRQDANEYLFLARETSQLQ